MRIRVIDLANNFYKDGQSANVQDGTLDDNRRKELGEYCCLGYFDALEVRQIDFDGKGNINIRKKVNQMMMKHLDGGCSRKNIICVTDDDKRDENFWAQAQNMPFLFVSLIRVNYENGDGRGRKQKLCEIIRRINEQGQMIAYYTYDHSDIVVLKYGKEYLRDVGKVLSLRRGMNVFKTYSVFAVKETVLDSCAEVQDEIVNCRLHAAVKDMCKVEDFLEEIKDFLGKGEMGTVNIKCYDTLGNNDLLIEISHVSIRQLLKCYRMGELLTHTHPSYQRAFFNIQSQLFGDGKGI